MDTGRMDDGELLVAFAAGEETAFAELYLRHRIEIYRYVLSLTRGDEQLAHDMYQDTFLKIYEHASDLQTIDNVRAWMFTIARNCCLSHFRRRKRQIRFGVEEECIEDEAVLRPDEAMEALDRQEALDDAIARLPDTQRTALVLRTFNDHSYAEIAKITETNVGIVRQRIWRAKKALRSMLASRFDDSPREES